MNIRPFRIAIPDAEIADLRRRLEQTRWPSGVNDVGWAAGMDLGFLHGLAEYWHTRFDWRRVESELNAVPHFQAELDSETLHFVHLKGSGENPLPIVLTHGWPSTFAELLKLGRLLASPQMRTDASGDAFDVIIPSLPGYAFSALQRNSTVNSFTVAERWSALMKARGYSRFIAHGGDLGAGVSTALGLRHPEQVLALHLNYIPGSYRPHLNAAAALTTEEEAFLNARQVWVEQEGGYSHVQSTKPDTLSPAFNDSPIGLAAWIIDKFRTWSDCNGDVTTRFSLDELLTTVSLYWFTQSMPSAMRFYWEGRRAPLQLGAGERVKVPVAVAHFPRELPMPPQSYVERGYNVVRWTQMRRGGHFAAMEEPEALAADIADFARQFRTE